MCYLFTNTLSATWWFHALLVLRILTAPSYQEVTFSMAGRVFRLDTSHAACKQDRTNCQHKNATGGEGQDKDMHPKYSRHSPGRHMVEITFLYS